MNAYLTNIRMHLKLMMRDRTVLFFNYVFPLIFFFMFGQLYDAGQGGTVRQVVTMVLTIGVLGAGLFGAGMRSVMDREQNILRRFKVAPLGAGPMVVASIVTGLIAYLPNVFLTIVLAHYYYGMPWPTRPWSLFAFISLGTIAFRALGSIVGSVVNSMQESQIVIQLLYFPMLMLSGATIPLGIMPQWLQIVANFLPSTHLFTGMQAILSGREGLADHWRAVAALFLTTALGGLLAVKLFRWEKDERLPATAKAWVLAVLAPFVVMGVLEAYTRDNVSRTKILERDIARGQSWLIRDVKVIHGDGGVTERGAVLIRAGRIARIFTGASPDADSLKAEPVEGAGRTVIPALVDARVDLMSPGGTLPNPADYSPQKSVPRALAAYLYSGVAAVRTGGAVDRALEETAAGIATGEKLGAEPVFSGVLFARKDGAGAEMLRDVPEAYRSTAETHLFRFPASADEARQMVRDLKHQGATSVRAWSGGDKPIEPAIFRAIAAEAAALGLPLACYTTDAAAVAAALDAGASQIENGSFTELLPRDLLERMKSRGVTYIPMLASIEARAELGRGSLALLDRPLVRQVGPPALLESTRKTFAALRASGDRSILDLAGRNLAAAVHAGVTVAAGTGSGAMLLPHGPAIHRELQLWVEAGVDPRLAVQAATFHAASAIGLASRLGRIHEGAEATLLILDGDPVADIKSTERLSTYFFRGGRVNRVRLFEDFK
ncbi:MAG: ABC transporter permease [Bryobacteraceae bacterium]|nr:ABC transporter permease [Bryobacteraceae bacterium]